MKVYAKIFLILTFTLGAEYMGVSQDSKSCLFKNPLCFYNTDILSYLQVLHKNQQYDKMCTFFYGPLIESIEKSEFEKKLNDVDFGYTLKRVGIKEISKTKWSLTYQRTIMGTNENFKIDCELVDGACKIFLDKKQWNNLFQ
jgi:hypothetical protein